MNTKPETDEVSTTRGCDGATCARRGCPLPIGLIVRKGPSRSSNSPRLPAPSQCVWCHFTITPAVVSVVSVVPVVPVVSVVPVVPVVAASSAGARRENM